MFYYKAFVFLSYLIGKHEGPENGQISGKFYLFQWHESICLWKQWGYELVYGCDERWTETKDKCSEDSTRVQSRYSQAKASIGEIQVNIAYTVSENKSWALYSIRFFWDNCSPGKVVHLAVHFAFLQWVQMQCLCSINHTFSRFILQWKLLILIKSMDRL